MSDQKPTEIQPTEIQPTDGAEGLEVSELDQVAGGLASEEAADLNGACNILSKCGSVA